MWRLSFPQRRSATHRRWRRRLSQIAAKASRSGRPELDKSRTRPIPLRGEAAAVTKKFHGLHQQGRRGAPGDVAGIFLRPPLFPVRIDPRASVLSRQAAAAAGEVRDDLQTAIDWMFADLSGLSARQLAAIRLGVSAKKRPHNLSGAATRRVTNSRELTAPGAVPESPRLVGDSPGAVSPRLLSLPPALAAEPFDLPPRAELKAVLVAVGLEPGRLFRQDGRGVALRHRAPARGELRETRPNTPRPRGSLPAGRRRTSIGTRTPPQTGGSPRARADRARVRQVHCGSVRRRRGVRQLWADRHQIAGHRQIERARGLDRDVPTCARRLLVNGINSAKSIGSPPVRTTCRTCRR